MDTFDVLKTSAAVGGLVVSILSYLRAGRSDKRSQASEQKLVLLSEEHVALKQQVIAISNQRAGSGGQGGRGGTVTLVDSTVGGEIRTHGGAGGAGGTVHPFPPKEPPRKSPPQ